MTQLSVEEMEAGMQWKFDEARKRRDEFHANRVSKPGQWKNLFLPFSRPNMPLRHRPLIPLMGDTHPSVSQIARLAPPVR